MRRRVLLREESVATAATATRRQICTKYVDVPRLLGFIPFFLTDARISRFALYNPRVDHDVFTRAVLILPVLAEPLAGQTAICL